MNTRIALAAVLVAIVVGGGVYAIRGHAPGEETTPDLSGSVREIPNADTVTEGALVGTWSRNANEDCVSTDPADPCVEAIAYVTLGSREEGYEYIFSIHNSVQGDGCTWKLTKPEDRVSFDCAGEDSDGSFRVISLTTDSLTFTVGDVGESVTFKRVL